MYLCVCADRIRLKSFWWGVVVITQKFGDSKKNTKHDVDLQTQNSTLRCVLSSCDLCGHLYGPEFQSILLCHVQDLSNLITWLPGRWQEYEDCNIHQEENKTSWVRGYVGSRKEIYHSRRHNVVIALTHRHRHRHRLIHRLIDRQRHRHRHRHRHIHDTYTGADTDSCHLDRLRLSKMVEGPAWTHPNEQPGVLRQCHVVRWYGSAHASTGRASALCHSWNRPFLLRIPPYSLFSCQHFFFVI